MNLYMNNKAKMKITVLFFGELAEISGEHKIELQDLNDTDVLNEALVLQFPKLKTKKYRLSLNRELINIPLVLSDGDEIAVLPPFAGG